MTLPELPPPTPQELALLSIKSSVEKIQRELASLREAVATYAVNVINARDEIKDEISLLRDDLTKTRDHRVQMEEQQINTQLQRMEQDANELRKKLEEVQKTKGPGVDSEKIEQVADRVFTKKAEDNEKTKQLEQRTRFQKNKDAAVTAIVVTFAVGAAITLFVVLLPALIKFLETLAAGLQ